MPQTDAIVVGAGPAGLACAVTMRTAGLNVAVLEQSGSVGSVWRRHCDRLHLHTDRKRSGLPGMAMPKTFPVYPSREQMVSYLEDYAARFDIRPVFNTTVSRLQRDGAHWRAEADKTAFSAPVAVIATGIAGAPYRPAWPGSELYRGEVIHSSDYRNPLGFATKRVLVVGFGNSGGEIALDLANAGIDVALAVRSPVQILPRDLLGFPILAWAILYAPFAGAPGRPDQRADLAAGRRPGRGSGIAPRRQRAAANSMARANLSTRSFWRPASTPTCGHCFPMRKTCSTVTACRASRAGRQASPGFISAGRSLRRPDSCARSASKRSGLPTT